MRFKLMWPIALCLSVLANVGLAQTIAELGTVENGRYRNLLTNVELAIPDGWAFKGDGPSSGNGQMAMIESGSGITV